MQQELLEIFKEHPQLALIISLCISVLVAVIGIIPSFFVTAANIVFFGFWGGTFISFIGESVGAGIAFLLYRKGLKRSVNKNLLKYPSLKKLTDAGGMQAFYLVFLLRLIPFVPSGLVTFAAAIGRISLYIFLAASSLGKLPALFMESLSVYEVTKFEWPGKLILLLFVLVIIVWIIRNRKGSHNPE